MKRNLVVLVLLVTVSLMSVPLLASAAQADRISNTLSGTGESNSQDLVVNVCGAADDDTGGDPGDAGDGYGISDTRKGLGDLSGAGGADASGLDEMMLILSALIQLVI